MNEEEELDGLIADLEPALAAAFIAAILLLRAGIDFDALVIALRVGDIQAALAALNIDRGAFSRYVLQQQVAFEQVGTQVAGSLTKQRKATLPKRDSSAPAVRSPVLQPPIDPPALSVPAPGGGDIVFRFDMTNPRAEARIRDQAAARVAGYVEEQIEIARKVIGDGYQRGDGPKTIATDIAGRVNPISGRREGGIIGLSDPQAGYVENMRRRLQSGDPAEMLKVLGRFRDGKWVPGTGQTLRDRRFDRTIQKAIREIAAGKPNPLTPEKIEEMASKYADRLLARRAEDIARTETASGVEMARAEATKQAIDKAGLPDDAVTKAWIHQGGPDHARNWHLAMNNRTVKGIDTPFILPDGSVMQYPHDPAGGARNNVSCKCRGDNEVNWAFGLL